MKSNNLFKHLIFLIAVFALESGWAQCPPADVVLTTQSEVDNFPVEWPNCSGVTGNLTIHLQSTTDLISDLTPLGNLENIQNEIRLFTDFESQEPLLLDGLENISSASGIVIGIPSQTASPAIWISSLNPLSGISGTLNNFSCSNAVIDEMGVFQNITSIVAIRFTSSPSITELPEFPSLTYLGYMQMHNTGLETLVIPPSISTFSTTDGQAPLPEEPSGLYVQANSSLESIICESSFDQIFEIQIVENPNLSLISGFESLHTVDKRLELKGNHTLMFNAFKNLESARRIILEHLDPAPGSSTSTWNITIGQNAPEFTITSNFDFTETQGLSIKSNHVAIILFQANLTEVHGDFTLTGPLATSVTGFENLGSVSRDFYLSLESISSLPDFTGLTHIGRDFNLKWELASFEDLTGLNNLQHVGRNCRLGGTVTLFDTFFQSLNGLENLNYVGNDLIIGGLPNLYDIYALTDIETIGGNLKFFMLPNLYPDYITFNNLQTVGGIMMELLEMEVPPVFPELTTINGTLSFINMENLTEMSGFPNLQEVNYIRFQNNPNLIQINCNSELVANSFRLTGNYSLEECDSPCICQILEHSTANNILLNGDDCGYENDILLACGLLSTGDSDAESDIRMWIDDAGRLTLQSHKNTLKGSLDIYDISGRQIMQKNLDGNDLYYSTPFPNAASGIYFVEIRTDAGRYGQKVFWKR